MKVVEYKVISGFSLKTVELDVNHNIKEGWVPQGGIFHQYEYMYHQAMVMYND